MHAKRSNCNIFYIVLLVSAFGKKLAKIEECKRDREREKESCRERKRQIEAPRELALTLSPRILRLPLS